MLLKKAGCFLNNLLNKIIVLHPPRVPLYIVLIVHLYLYRAIHPCSRLRPCLCFCSMAILYLFIYSTTFYCITILRTSLPQKILIKGHHFTQTQELTRPRTDPITGASKLGMPFQHLESPSLSTRTLRLCPHLRVKTNASRLLWINSSLENIKVVRLVNIMIRLSQRSNRNRIWTVVERDSKL